MNPKLLIVFGCLSVLIPCSPAQAQERTESYYHEAVSGGVHDAGLVSFHYGPAILTSWKSAVFMGISSAKRRKVEPIAFSEPAGFPKRDITPPITFKFVTMMVNQFCFEVRKNLRTLT
jgi:hypothetical protein